MGINEDHYGTLRKYIADKLETYDFQKEEMDMLQCSKEEFIQEIRTDRKFVGQEILSYISKLLNINLIIYLKYLRDLFSLGIFYYKIIKLI